MWRRTFSCEVFLIVLSVMLVIHGSTTDKERDMTLPILPSQGEIYNTLPQYGGVDCWLLFFADAQGIIRVGRRAGCD